MRIVNRLAVSVLLAWCSLASAGPTTSPSAVLAARLKNHPPPGYIRHYLPDDRLRVHTGYWKVVSTQFDTYFHRASCPLMLRQPAGIVIGFTSVADALDAGYAADPHCSPTLGAGMVRGSISVAGGNSTSARRITLSDGSTTLTLPAGWRHMPGGTRPLTNTGTMSMDILTAPGGRGMVMVAGLTSNQVKHIERYLDARVLRQNMQSARTQVGRLGVVNNRLDNVLQNAFKSQSIRQTSLGGMRAVSIRSPGGAGMPAGTIYLGGRGSRAYILAFANGADRASGARTLLRSFNP